MTSWCSRDLGICDSVSKREQQKGTFKCHHFHCLPLVPFLSFCLFFAKKRQNWPSLPGFWTEIHNMPKNPTDLFSVGLTFYFTKVASFKKWGPIWVPKGICYMMWYVDKIDKTTYINTTATSYNLYHQCYNLDKMPTVCYSTGLNIGPPLPASIRCSKFWCPKWRSHFSAPFEGHKYESKEGHDLKNPPHSESWKIHMFFFPTHPLILFPKKRPLPLQNRAVSIWRPCLKDQVFTNLPTPKENVIVGDLARMLGVHGKSQEVHVEGNRIPPKIPSILGSSTSQYCWWFRNPAIN